MSRPSSITLEDCQSLFYLPVAQAAAVLGVSRPTISKVLRANGIKRWPYRKLRAEGKLDDLRQRRQANHTSVLPVLPPIPPPLPPGLENLDTEKDGPASDINCHTDRSVKTELEFPRPQPQQSIPDDETYILHLLDRPISPLCQIEDETHPFLSLAPEPVWTCNEQLSGRDVEQDHQAEPSQSPQSPSPSLPQQEIEEFHSDTRSHTISTVRPTATAVIGSGAWSRGVFRQDGDRMSFAFLPTIPFGSSLSDEDPLDGNAGSEV